MSVFISYSHEDKDFVDRLAMELIKKKARVWIDRWEINVGESLVEKIQSAMSEADALLVVLSNAFVNSEWCKRELSAGLMRELSEKRVLLLPVLIEDCEIPLLLKEKRYADFRRDFDEGLTTILEAIARVTSDTLGRLYGKEYHTDFSISWGMNGDRFQVQVYCVSMTPDHPFSVLTKLDIIGNEVATDKFRQMYEAGFDDVMKNFVLGYCAGFLKDKKLHFVLDDSFPKTRSIGLRSATGSDEYEIQIEIRRLGEDTGKNIFFDCGDIFQYALSTALSNSRKLDNDELKTVFGIMKTLASDR